MPRLPAGDPATSAHPEQLARPLRLALRANWILGFIFGPAATFATLLSQEKTTWYELPWFSLIAVALFSATTLVPFAFTPWLARRVARRPGNGTATAAPVLLSAAGGAAVNLWTCWVVATVRGTGSQFAAVGLFLFPLCYCALVLAIFLLFIFVWESWTWWARSRKEREGHG